MGCLGGTEAAIISDPSVWVAKEVRKGRQEKVVLPTKTTMYDRSAVLSGFEAHFHEAPARDRNSRALTLKTRLENEVRRKMEADLGVFHRLLLQSGGIKQNTGFKEL